MAKHVVLFARVPGRWKDVEHDGSQYLVPPCPCSRAVQANHVPHAHPQGVNVSGGQSDSDRTGVVDHAIDMFHVVSGDKMLSLIKKMDITAELGAVGWLQMVMFVEDLSETAPLPSSRSHLHHDELVDQGPRQYLRTCVIGSGGFCRYTLTCRTSQNGYRV